jgi:hypothetical protein
LERHLLGLQLGDGRNKEIKEIPFFQRAFLAFGYKLHGDFEE